MIFDIHTVVYKMFLKVLDSQFSHMNHVQTWAYGNRWSRLEWHWPCKLQGIEKNTQEFEMFMTME